MAGYDNIKDKGWDSRSPEDCRELARRGGIASGEARRKKADFRKKLNTLLTAQVDTPEWKPMLDALGVDNTLESAVLMAQIAKATTGDTEAARFVAQYSGQSKNTELEDEIARRSAEADIELKKAKEEAMTGAKESDEALERLDEILRGLRDAAVKQETK